MKKFIKTLTIIGGICAGLGLIFLIIGLILGGGTIDFSDAVSVQESDVSRLIHKLTPIDSEYRDDDIENLDSERWECTSASGIKNLQIEMDAGYLEIKQYEGREIQVYIQQNDRKTKIEQEGDELDITRDGIQWLDRKGKAIKILVPKNHIFNEMDLKLNAVDGVIDSLKANELTVSANAASLEITDEIQTKTCEWTANAAEIEIQKLMSRETDLDCSAGTIRVTMEGDISDYYLEGKVSAGSLEYAHQEWDGFDDTFCQGEEDAKNRIEAKCAAGDITIDFTKYE